MQRDIRKLVATHCPFVDDGIKGMYCHTYDTPVYCVFIVDLLTYVGLECGRWYGRLENTPLGARPCHLEKAYRTALSGIVDRWVAYHKLSDLVQDPDTLPEVGDLLAVSL